MGALASGFLTTNGAGSFSASSTVLFELLSVPSGGMRYLAISELDGSVPHRHNNLLIYGLRLTLGLCPLG